MASSDYKAEDAADWPPGTLTIELLRGGNNDNTEIILQPRPSADPNDPLNWTKLEKYWNFSLVCYYSFMVWVLIDAATPTWGPMNEQLGFSYTILNDSYAIGCGTLGIGAFVLIPFALKYGRRPIYILSTAAEFAITVWSARLTTVADLLLVNALSCFVAALSEVIVQMTIADVFFVHQRGFMNSIYIIAQNAGANLGPLAAGYITVGQGWRWVWWWIAIFFGIGFIAMTFSYEETKFDHEAAMRLVSTEPSPSSQVSSRPSSKTAEMNSLSDAKKMRVGDEKMVDIEIGQEDSPEAGYSGLTVGASPEYPIPLRKTYLQRLKMFTTTLGPWMCFLRHSYQPVQIMFTIPAVAYMSLVYGALQAWSTVMTVNLSSYMLGPPWNFDSAGIGLMSLPPFIGSTLGSLLCGPLSDWIIIALSKRNNGIFEPEMRLWAVMPFIIFLPLGAFLYGYGLALGWSWPAIAIAYAVSNFGSAPISGIALTYITDSYTEIVGDALVGVSFTRNLLSTIFVFALSPWIASVGLANVYITIGVIGIAILAGMPVFIWKGKGLRVKSSRRYRTFAARQFGARLV